MANGIKIGNLDISAFKVGSDNCKVYLGDTLLYPQSQHDYSQDYFTIVSDADNNTIKLSNRGYNTTSTSTSYWNSIPISASTDGGSTWSGFTTSRNKSLTLGTINKGQKMLLKGNATKFANITSAHHYFDNTENFSVEGNTLSLFYGDNFLSYDSLPTISSKELNRTMQLGCIFRNSTKLISAENMILPTGTLTLKCYGYMFNGCTSLVAAPSSIGTSATTLAEGCCTNMFYSCTSLVTAPELPATTLANNCYSSMFNGCTSLTTAPELPATTLANSCYSSMFYNCTSLVTAPELPATTLANSCYSYMFRGCTSLTTAPVLSAATLVYYCYNGLFNSCTNLNSITCLATDISSTNCTLIWVSDVAASGTFTKSSSMNDWTTGVDGIPNGWSEQNYS